MDKEYKTGEVASLLGVTAETVRSWTDKFDAYLSDDATAKYGSHRAYHPRDIRVLVFVNENRGKMTHDEIFMSLSLVKDENDLPPMPEELTTHLTVAEVNQKLLELDRAYQLQQVELDAARLELARLEERLKQADEVEHQLSVANDRIEQQVKLITKLRVLLAIEKGEEINIDE